MQLGILFLFSYHVHNTTVDTAKVYKGKIDSWVSVLKFAIQKLAQVKSSVTACNVFRVEGTAWKGRKAGHTWRNTEGSQSKERGLPQVAKITYLLSVEPVKLCPSFLLDTNKNFPLSRVPGTWMPIGIPFAFSILIFIILINANNWSENEKCFSKIALVVNSKLYLRSWNRNPIVKYYNTVRVPLSLGK